MVFSNTAEILRQLEDDYLREGWDSLDVETFILPYHKIILDLSKEVEKLKEKNGG